MEGHLQLDGHRTWYQVVGDIDPGARQAPAILCHGGPGATHDYLEPIAELHRSGRACVLYDQLGNGRSDHLPDADPAFWTPELFERELAALAAHLGIDGRYHVIGQSWGGMLALVHGVECPPGLLSIVAADSPASIADFVAAPTSCSTRSTTMWHRPSAPASAAARPPRPSSGPRRWSSTSASYAAWTRGRTSSRAASRR
jgi:proline-specific peptidase